MISGNRNSLSLEYFPNTPLMIQFQISIYDFNYFVLNSSDFNYPELCHLCASASLQGGKTSHLSTIIIFLIIIVSVI